MQDCKSRVITPFGGCLIHNPLAEFYRLEQTVGLFSKENGWRSRPFSLSANTNLQLVDFMTGAIEIPEWIRSYIYFEAVDAPTREQTRQFMSGDLALVEMSTPIEYLFQGFLLNVNRFEVFVQELVKAYPERKKAIVRWQKALKQVQEDKRREAAQDVCAFLRAETQEDLRQRAFVAETTSRRLSLDDMTASTATLRDRLGVPTALVIHNYGYMPDGRPVSWPADFKRNSFEVARRLGMSTLDLAGYVQARGAHEVLSFDYRHFADPHLAPIGGIMHAFGEAVLDPARGVFAAMGLEDGQTSHVPLESGGEHGHSPELRKAIESQRARFNEVVTRARSIDRSQQPRLYLAAWKKVLEVSPTSLTAWRKVIGGAGFLKDYAELYEAVLGHMKIAPGDRQFALKLAGAAVRCGREVAALDFLVEQGLVERSENAIALLCKRVRAVADGGVDPAQKAHALAVLARCPE